MYAVVICPGCRQPRGVKLSSKRSRCPRCGREVEVRKALIHFRSSDQREIRAAINAMTGFVPEAPEPPSDPRDALRRRVREVKDPESRLNVLAAGLEDVLGQFTLADLEELFPEEGERYLKLLIQHALVMEPSSGVYQVL